LTTNKKRPTDQFIFLPIAGRFLSQFGDWFFLVLASLSIYQVTGSGLAVGALALTRILPAVVIGPACAPLVARAHKWRLLAVLDLLRGLLVLTAVVRPDPYLLLAVSFALAGAQSVYGVAYRCAIAESVPPERLMRINALRSSLGNLSLTLGPAAAGGILALYGGGVGLLIDAATFFLCAGTMIAAHRAFRRDLDATAESPDGTSEARGATWQSLAGLLQDPVLRTFALALACAGFGYGAYHFLAVYVQDVLRSSEATLGLLHSAMGVGGVASFLLLLLPLDRMNPTVCHAAGCLIDATCLAGLCAGGGPALACLLLLTSGANDTLVASSSDTVIQRATTESNRAQVFAGVGALSSLASVLAISLIGGLIDLLGVGPTFMLSAGALVTAAAVSFSLRRGLSWQASQVAGS